MIDFNGDVLYVVVGFLLILEVIEVWVGKFELKV